MRITSKQNLTIQSQLQQHPSSVDPAVTRNQQQLVWDQGRQEMQQLIQPRMRIYKEEMNCPMRQEQHFG